MTSIYYNDNDPYCAEWLANLIAAGHLPAGEVDQRDVREVGPHDLEGYGQAHFFAGIGGWPYALGIAGWKGPVWTASIPCQPLSSAGRRKGHADERHLWPAFHRLVAELRPPVIFGEQVASKDGREWLAGVRADLEQLGYAVGCADLPAAGVGAPHIRQRLWWVANADGGNASTEGLQRGGQHGQQPQDGEAGGRLGHSNERHAPEYPLLRQGSQDTIEAGGSSITSGLANAENPNRRGPSNAPNSRRRSAKARGPSCWIDYDLIPCADGKARRVEPSTFPLAHGVPARVGRLRAYGNAIVPQVAAEFVRAFMETRP